MADPIDVTLGSRSAQVWKFNADGSPTAVTPEDAAASAIGSLSAHANARRSGITGALGTAFDAARDFANQNVSNILQHGLSGAPTRGLPPDVQDPTALVMSPETADSVSKYIVPQTPAGASAMAAFGPLSKLGYFALPAAAALGGAANVVTGEDPTRGALEGAVGHALPRVVAPVLKWLTGLPSRFITKAGEESVGMQHADRILKGMGVDVPELAGAATGRSPAERLLSVQDAEVGHKALGAIMDVTENPIKQALPDVQFEIPGISEVKPSMGGAPVTPPAQLLYDAANPATKAAIRNANPGFDWDAASNRGKTVGIASAMQELKNLKAEARAVYSRDNPLASVELTKRATQLEDDIYNVIAAQNQPLADAWKKSMEKFAKGLDYIHLSKATVQGVSAKGTPVDIMQSVDHILQNYRDFAPSRLPGLHQELFPGAQAGTQPVISDPGLYARAFIPGPGHFKANIPSPRFIQRPGIDPGLNLPKNAVVPALLNLSEPGLDAIRNR